MKAHTQEFKNAIKHYGRQIATRITYQSNGTTVVLGKVELNSVSLHYEGAILKSVMRQMDIDSNVEIPLETTLHCEFGVKVNGAYEYLTLGDFIVYEIEQQKDKRSYMLTCYDKMLYSMVDYENMGITYPITVRDYINAVATYLGLTFKNASDTFANWNKQIPAELYLDGDGNSMGYKFRDVLDELAQVTASTICINESTNELEVRYPQLSQRRTKNLVNIELGYDRGYINSSNVFVSDNKNALFNQHIPVESGTTYTFSVNQTIDNMVISYYSNDNTFQGRKKVNNTTKITQEIPANVDYVRWCVNYDNSTTITDEIVEGLEPQVEIGSARTNYEPYIIIYQDEIDEEFLSRDNVNIGEKYGPINSIVLSRAAGADNVYLRDETSVTENGLCEIKIVDNQIMNFNDRSSYLVDILATLDGLEYYLNDISSTAIAYYDVCDKYTITIGENSYPCIMFNDELNITQGVEEKIFTDIPPQSETDYSKADKTDRKINQTYIIVDKQNQEIEAVVSQVGQQNTKIAQVNQNVDELNAKISDIADITITGESNEAYLEMNQINASEPIGIKIHPVSENISYLYPNSGLFPSSNLFGKTRIIRFTNTTTNEIFNLILPDDLLYYNSSVYDEFILDYENEIFQVIKRCRWNNDGTVAALGTEEIHNYTYQHINLTDGNYTVEILGYSSAYLYVRLMAANIYTSQFATRVEMTSAINQKANEINIVVAQKLDEEEFTKAEIVAKINDNTSQVKIAADKVDIKSNDVLNLLANNSLNLTSKNMTITSNNFNVDTNGNLSASNASISGNITATSGTFNGVVNASGGTIGGFTLNANRLYSGSGTSIAGIGVNGRDQAFWAGNDNSGNAPFRVDHAGNLTASAANITGTINATSGSFTGTINATSGSFTGTIHASSGSFSGTIRSSSGNIGGWTINSSGITGSYGGVTTTLTPRGYKVDTGTTNYWVAWTDIRHY